MEEMSKWTRWKTCHIVNTLYHNWHVSCILSSDKWFIIFGGWISLKIWLYFFFYINMRNSYWLAFRYFFLFLVVCQVAYILFNMASGRAQCPILGYELVNCIHYPFKGLGDLFGIHRHSWNVWTICHIYFPVCLFFFSDRPIVAVFKTDQWKCRRVSINHKKFYLFKKNNQA